MIKRLCLHYCAFAFFFCLSLTAGCSGPYKSVRLLPADQFKEKSKNAVNSSMPSWETRQTLRLMSMDKDYRKDHRKVISEIEQMVKKEPSPELRMALAELSLLEAQRYAKSDMQKAMERYLVAAQQSYDYLFLDVRSVSSSPLSPSFRFMADIYNLAVAELLE